MLKTLAANERTATLKLLDETEGADSAAWKAAKQYILYGGDVAGHGIDEATIGGDRAALFEFRTIPEELKEFVPKARENVAPVVDPLAALGQGRLAAVREINSFVAKPDNLEDFAKWYQATFKKYTDKEPDAIAKLATALQKLAWIMAERPQKWQEISQGPAT